MFIFFTIRSAQNPSSFHMSLSDSTKSDDARLVHKRNCKAPFAVLSSFRCENSLIRVISEEIT